MRDEEVLQELKAYNFWRSISNGGFRDGKRYSCGV
jgi:hypothetical protein